MQSISALIERPRALSVVTSRTIAGAAQVVSNFGSELWQKDYILFFVPWLLINESRRPRSYVALAMIIFPDSELIGAESKNSHRGRNAHVFRFFFLVYSRRRYLLTKTTLLRYALIVFFVEDEEGDMKT